MNLLILSENVRADDSSYVVSDHRARHIIEILKLGVGSNLRAGLLNGPQGVARIISIANNTVALDFLESTESVDLGSVDIICAVPRPKSLRKVLYICAMMNVRRLTLTRASRVDKSYLQSPLLTPAGYLPILLDGLAQGGRTRLPEISLQPLLRPYVEDALTEVVRVNPDATYLIAHNDDASNLSDFHIELTSPVTVAIGPEGGWTPFEVDLFLNAGFQKFTLGPWTLRVEAAVTAALAQVELRRQVQTVDTSVEQIRPICASPIPPIRV